MTDWPVVPLGEVADTALGKMLDKGKARGLPRVPYLRNVNVQWGQINTDDVLMMELGDHERERFAVREGDLLVCEGGEVGRCAIWRGSADYVAYQKALHRIRPSADLDATYLRYVLEYHASNGTLSRLSTGSTIAHLPQQQLRRVPVPLPPVSVQRRIVGILEDHLSRLDAGDAYLAAAEKRVARWRSVASEVEIFRDDPPMRPVRELLREPMRNGRSDRAVRSGESGTRTLTLTAVTRNRFDDQHTKFTSTSPERANGLWLQPGDIFVQRSNTPELVGSAARYDGPPNWAIFPDLLIRLRADESVIDSRFLAAALRSGPVHQSLRSQAKGLAGSMPKVDQRAIAETMIPVPEAEKQRRALQKLSAIDAAGDVASREIQGLRRRQASLRQALLAAAFSGRLTGRSAKLGIEEEYVNS